MLKKNVRSVVPTFNTVCILISLIGDDRHSKISWWYLLYKYQIIPGVDIWNYSNIGLNTHSFTSVNSIILSWTHTPSFTNTHTRQTHSYSLPHSHLLTFFFTHSVYYFTRTFSLAKYSLAHLHKPSLIHLFTLHFREMVLKKIKLRIWVKSVIRHPT